MKMIYKVVPVQDRKTLAISWLLKNKENLYESPPGRYIGHLLGHEGKGSLLSFLVK
jgi:insulysin